MGALAKGSGCRYSAERIEEDHTPFQDQLTILFNGKDAGLRRKEKKNP